MPLSYLKIFYTFEDEIETLTMAERGRLLTAMLAYGQRGEVPPDLLTGNERILFPVCRQRIDRDVKSYEHQVEANQVNGRKGGRPRKNPFGFPKTQDKDNDQEKEKEKDQDQEKEYARARQRPAWTNPALNYIQRAYRDEDFGDNFFVDLDKYS